MKLNHLFAALISLNVLTVIAPELAIAQGERIQTYAGAQKRTGRAAIAAVIGKPVIMNFGPSQQLVFNFDSQTRVRVKRPAPNNDEIVGTITNDRDSNKVCFDFAGKAPATCDRLEYQNGKLLLIANDGRRIEGAVTTGVAENSRPAATQVPPNRADPKFCEPLLQIVEAGKRGNFASLVDTKREVIRPELDFLDDVPYSKVRLGTCLAHTHKDDPRPKDHRCFIETQPNELRGDQLYQSLLERAALCIPGELKSGDVQKAPAPNMLKQKVATSVFTLNDKLKLFIWLGPNHVCMDYHLPNCKWKYGVTLRIRSDADRPMDKHGQDVVTAQDLINKI